MKVSYSRIDCFNQCPKKYDFRYNQKLEVIPEQAADNPLWIGSALHKGIETTPQEGVENYLSNFYLLTDQIVNWSMQIEHWCPIVKDQLPNGKHEVEISDDSFVGYIDYLGEDTIFDFKFTVPKNYPKYLESKQLHLYKYFLEKNNPDVEVKHLKYIFIPKCLIRQKKTESIMQFRDRLLSEMDNLNLEIAEVPYDPTKVQSFLEDCERLKGASDFPKNESRLCDYCEYKWYCQSDGAINYMIL